MSLLLRRLQNVRMHQPCTKFQFYGRHWPTAVESLTVYGKSIDTAHTDSCHWLLNWWFPLVSGAPGMWTRTLLNLDRVINCTFMSSFWFCGSFERNTLLMCPVKTSLMCQTWTIEPLRNFKHRKWVSAHMDASTVFCLFLMVDVRFQKCSLFLAMSLPSSA